MKFNSQICTTKEQSERLLALGLKKETADCRICPLVTDPNQYLIMDMGIQPLDEDDGEIPAWSLNRLLEILHINYIELWLDENAYEQVISLIEEQMKESCFNKEYLEE